MPRERNDRSTHVVLWARNLILKERNGAIAMFWRMYALAAVTVAALPAWGSDIGISHQQADDIVNELRQIHQLLSVGSSVKT